MRLRDLRAVPDPPWVHVAGWLLVAAIAVAFFFDLSRAAVLVITAVVFAEVIGVLLLRIRCKRRAGDR
jgi:hypothetical protein